MKLDIRNTATDDSGAPVVVRLAGVTDAGAAVATVAAALRAYGWPFSVTAGNASDLDGTSYDTTAGLTDWQVTERAIGHDPLAAYAYRPT